MNLVTFIVPTIGRPTLDRTLKSLLEQTDPDWNAIVVADAVYGFHVPRLDDRIMGVNLLKKRGAPRNGGYVRNHGVGFASGEWVAFVDDDDRIDPDYVKWLREEQDSADIIVFRMKYFDGRVLPLGDSIGPGGVGISFAVRHSFLRYKKLSFGNSDIEDWAYLEAARNQDARIRISPHVAYYVSH